jgi:hypothetical protein
MKEFRQTRPLAAPKCRGLPALAAAERLSSRILVSAITLAAFPGAVSISGQNWSLPGMTGTKEGQFVIYEITGGEKKVFATEVGVRSACAFVWAESRSVSG